MPKFLLKTEEKGTICSFINPFADKDFIVYYKIMKSETGYYYLDSGKAVKYYRGHKMLIGERLIYLIDLFDELSPLANKIFVRVLNSDIMGRDYFYFHEENYCKKIGVHIKTFRKAMIELRENKIIQKVQGKESKHYYWINPAVIYSGSRINKYPQNKQRI